MQGAHIVLFDFDGVIIDSFKPAFEVNKLICPHTTEEEYRSRFDGNINEYEDLRAHTADCRRDLDFFTELTPRLKHTDLIPGIDDAIIALAEQYPLIIISSTTTVLIKERLETHNLGHCFVQILGNDVHTSKIEKLKSLFPQYGVTPSSYIFITDTLGDMREAAHLGVNTIGVSWGFQPVERLQQGNPFRIVHTPKELPVVVEEYFQSYGAENNSKGC